MRTIIHYRGKYIVRSLVAAGADPNSTKDEETEVDFDCRIEFAHCFRPTRRSHPEFFVNPENLYHSYLFSGQDSITDWPDCTEKSIEVEQEEI